MRLIDADEIGLTDFEILECRGSYKTALEMILKKIEKAPTVTPQDPILDKIRAEIWDLQYGDEEKSMTDEDRADAYNNAIRQVIEIIDKHKEAVEIVEDLCIKSEPTVEAIPKDQYETRLKADMVAMLTEIQLEIEELEVPLLYLAEDYEGGVLDCKKIIQQKINALKGDQAAG